MDGNLPPKLLKFLTILMTGRPVCSKRMERLVHSFGQDISRAATSGAWKQPKHVLLCITLRHLFRSEKLINILNRFGHCENYSFSLELETAIAQTVSEMSSVLSPQIIRNPDISAVFHSEFDNFDQLINTLTGMYSVHTAHGIMLQELHEDTTEHIARQQNASCKPRTGQRSLHEIPVEQLPECYMTARKGPALKIHNTLFPECLDEVKKSTERQMLWMMTRFHQHGRQSIPAWSGFVFLTGEKTDRITIIDYFPVIPKPITEYQTVQECLRYSEQATSEAGQEYRITTFDLWVCMKAFP